jgi:hypothetical protein
MLAQFLNPDLCSQRIANMEEVQLYFGVGGCRSLTRAAVAYTVLELLAYTERGCMGCICKAPQMSNQHGIRERL